ncbi:MAG: MurR/RpiR family transcriptional regulator [Bacillota bacterium]
MSIIKELKQLRKNNKLTPKEQILASYILDNIKKVPQLNMDELANNCDTSTGTIQRLVQKLNLEGFTDFKQRLLKDNFHSNSSINIDITNINQSDSPYQYLFKKITDKSQVQIIKIINESIYGDKNGYLNELYFEYLEDADNIVVFDYDDNFGYSLSQLLLKQNYFNKYSTSIKKTEKILESSFQTLKRKKKILESRFKESMEVFNMIDFSSLFSKNNFFNNLLIITAIEQYNDKIENLVKKANDMDFNVLIFYNGDHKSLIENSLYNMSLNLGGTISVKEKNYESKQLSPQLFLEAMNIFYQDNFE